jgi:hypothetical protein
VSRRPIVRALGVVAALALGLAAWTVRVVVAGDAELDASDAALGQGDAHEAVVHARRAASWYAPGAPHVPVAYRRLIALATAAEAHRRRDVALFAWRGVRQASLDTRWLLTPHAADRARAEQEIARLSAIGEREAAEPDAAAMAAALTTLAKDDGPRHGWVVALCAGLVVAAGGLAAAMARIAAPAQVEWKRGRAALAVAALGAVVWLLALWQA